MLRRFAENLRVVVEHNQPLGLRGMGGRGEQKNQDGEMRPWIRPDQYWVSRYAKRLADPDFFKKGQPHLADVHYNLRYEPMVAYDWAYRGLSDDERKLFARGIQTLAQYRVVHVDLVALWKPVRRP